MNTTEPINRSDKTLLQVIRLLYEARTAAFREKNKQAWERADRAILLLQNFEIERWMEAQ